MHAADVWHLGLFTGPGSRTESNLTESGSAVPTTHLHPPPTHKGGICVRRYMTLENCAGTKTPVIHIENVYQKQRESLVLFIQRQ